jgi:hypothetical protein
MPISYVTAASLDGTQNGSAPIYGARAWVNFNGTGTVAIRASGNVSSITDNGTGDYTVNFTTAMADANYSVVVSADPATGSGGIPICGLSYSGFSPTGSFARVRTTTTGAFADSATVCVSIFR